MSCFTYERRGPDGQRPMPPARWPSQGGGEARPGRSSASRRTCAANEDDAGLPETRPPDPGFTPYAHAWAAGDTLAEVLDDDEMTGGDFVRNVKQCIDLLRQVGDVAPDPETRRPGPRGRRRMPRGVVAASSVVTTT